MLAVDEGIFDRLVGSVELMLLTADFAGGKAVFTETPIPHGVVPPFIVVPSTLLEPSDSAFATKNSEGRLWVRDIACYTRATGDPSIVEQMAELIRGLFHLKNTEITIAGFGVMIATCSGPVTAPTDDTLYGRIVTVTLTVAE